ncbi:aldo/keto reductase, partial [bacterium]|nr:aldo/keto reductase [bacterium]
MKNFMKILNRRTFLSQGTKSIVTAGLAIPLLKGTNLLSYQESTAQGEESQKPSVEYRTLGRTGLKVTTVSYGAMRTRDEAIIHQALDAGINYIDTARGYMDGFNEQVVGNVLKNRRKDAYLATKILNGLDTAAAISESMEASLKALQVDYVDVIQFHMVSDVNYIKNETVMKAIQKIKEDGKGRFIGFTTHQNQVALIKEAIKLDFYDTILVGYSFQSPQELTDAIQEAAKAGIGIIAMKTQAGGYTNHQMGNLSPHQ